MSLFDKFKVGVPLPEIRTFGRMLFDPIWAQSRHPASACEILHVVEGKLSLIMDGDRTHTAGPGGTLVVPHGVIHRDEFAANEQLDLIYCSFQWRLAGTFFKSVDNDVIFSMSPHRRSQLCEMFDQVRADFSYGTPIGKMLLRARLLEILLFLWRETEKVDPKACDSSTRTLMLRAKAYIWEHYAEHVGLDDIAGALRVSPYHLSHVFSQESEFSLFSYLTQIRMDRARELLKERALNVGEVANSVGYDDPNYFAKVFQKNCGCSPKDYRGLGG